MFNNTYSIYKIYEYSNLLFNVYFILITNEKRHKLLFEVISKSHLYTLTI